MTESLKEEHKMLASNATADKVPSATFFDDIKFYTSGNVSEKVNFICVGLRPCKLLVKNNKTYYY